MTDLDAFAKLVPLDHGLVVVNTLRADGSVQSSVVNAGVLEVRAGWQWTTVEGDAEIIGPDDPRDDVDAEALRLLLRDVFVAAGGTHDDRDDYDRVMAEDRRAAVLVSPRRIYGTAGS